MSTSNQIQALPRTGLPTPGLCPDKTSTISRWTLFLGSIASGTSLEESMLKHYMKRADIEACIRIGAEERQRWNDARLAARKLKWSAFDIEDILARISGGMTVGDAVNLSRPEGTEEFTFLCMNDPEWYELYMRALKSRALIVSEQIIEIADGDGSGDYLDNGKGGFIPDNAKVNRDKLRADTRTKLMGHWFPKLFGEKQGTQVNVQINNHAARLEEARQRRDSRSSLKPLPEPIVDAVFNEAAAIDQDSWDDLKDATWREG